MLPDKRERLGRDDLEVTAFGLSLAPVGSSFGEVDEVTSDAMFQEAWNHGVRFFDTAPIYGHGLSELRTGYSLRWKQRDDFVLSSKVEGLLRSASEEDIDYDPWANASHFAIEFDYSYDGTTRSFVDDMQRLALERMDICFIQDIDRFSRGDEQPEVFEQAMDGAWRALSNLREQGLVKAIGVGVNEWEVCHAALERHDFDCFLLAGRYTLLEQDALDEFLPLCEERGTAVVVGGGFNSGIFATGAREGAKYNYAPAPPEVKDKVAKTESVCAEHKVPLPAAALQFVVAHPAIPSFIAGTRTLEQLRQNIKWFGFPIPAEFWTDLKGRGRPRADAPVPS